MYTNDKLISCKQELQLTILEARLKYKYISGNCFVQKDEVYN